MSKATVSIIAIILSCAFSSSAAEAEELDISPAVCKGGTLTMDWHLPSIPAVMNTDVYNSANVDCPLYADEDASGNINGVYVHAFRGSPWEDLTCTLYVTYTNHQGTSVTVEVDTNTAEGDGYGGTGTDSIQLQQHDSGLTTEEKKNRAYSVACTLPKNNALDSPPSAVFGFSVLQIE